MSIPTDPQSNAEPEPRDAAPKVAAAPSARSGAVTTIARPKARLKRKVVVRSPRPVAARPSRPSLISAADEEAEDGFFKRHGVVLVIVALVGAAGAYLALKKPEPPSAPVRQERIVMIAPLPPLPPPPPPPPPKQKPPEEKMEKETAPVEEPKPAEKIAPPKAPDAPAPLGTGLKGDGPGLSGLGNGPGLGGGTLGGGNGNKGGSRFGWYAGQVQAKIGEALRQNPKTRGSSLRLDVRIWPDSTGRITRAQLVGSTGDPALDSAIQNSVLTGLQLSEPPPAGMRLPINLRLTAQRPR